MTSGSAVRHDLLRCRSTLSHVANAYFDQHYDLDFSNPRGSSPAFVADEASAAVAELMAERLPTDMSASRLA